MLNPTRLQYATAAAASGGGWETIMVAPATSVYDANKTSYDPNFASPGTSNFASSTASGTGASTRTSGLGVYDAFFNKVGITKIALCGTDYNGSDPTTSSAYNIYDLVATTTKSLFQTLKDLDSYKQSNSNFAGSSGQNFPTDSVDNFVSGNAVSGTLVQSAGSMVAEGGAAASSFCVYGINQDSDRDTQALCFYSGNLTSGKGDAWRGVTPKETLFTYWGNDFHTNSQTQRIGNERQSFPGHCGSGQPTSDMVMMAY